VTLLETVRELKALGIDVFFEEQNIHTLSGEGELMLSILASYAQEESRSVSENIKWRLRNDMKSGKRKAVKVYGYTAVNGKLVINPDEAEVVRWIFDSILEGKGWITITNELNQRGIPGPGGKLWKGRTLQRVIKNPKMYGDILFQRTYIKDHISKKTMVNKGELPMYLIEDAHEGIIPKETYEAVMAELARRELVGSVEVPEGIAFRKKIYCAGCGSLFYHSSNGVDKHKIWICSGRRVKRICAATKEVMEIKLMEITAKVLGLSEYDGEAVTNRVERIIVHPDRKLTYVFHDGTKINAEWDGGRRGKSNRNTSE
jgi:hypothetical protein